VKPGKDYHIADGRPSFSEDRSDQPPIFQTVCDVALNTRTGHENPASILARLLRIGGVLLLF
jgi:hypothetical protein